jgi:hypothetical protein
MLAEVVCVLLILATGFLFVMNSTLIVLHKMKMNFELENHQEEDKFLDDDRSFDEHIQDYRKKLSQVHPWSFVEKNRENIVVRVGFLTYRFANVYVGNGKTEPKLLVASSIYQNENGRLLNRRTVRAIQHMLLETAVDRLVENPIQVSLDDTMQKVAETYHMELFDGETRSLSPRKIRICKREFTKMLRKIMITRGEHLMLCAKKVEVLPVYLRPRQQPKKDAKSAKSFEARGYTEIGKSSLVSQMDLLFH